MEEQLKSAEVTPLQEHFFYKPLMEKELESVEVTPSIKGHSGSHWVESQLKLEEVTPSQSMFLEMNSVQEEIKSGEITPEESIPLQSWLDLEKKEITPRNAIAPPFRWRKLDSEEVKPEKTTCFIDSVRWIKMNN